jgi:hypothetical protein
MINLKKITNKVLLIFTILFSLTFIVSIIGTMLIPSNSKFENPIIKAGHIQVNQENIQIYNSAYKCIQTYDLSGNFINKTKILYDILSSQKSTVEIINEYPFEAKIITKTQSINIKQSLWRYLTFPFTSWIFLVCCWIPFLMLNYSKVVQIIRQKLTTKELLTRIFNYLKS